MKKHVLTAIAVTSLFLGTGVSWGQTVTSTNATATSGDNGGNGYNGQNGDLTGNGANGGSGAANGGQGGYVTSSGGAGGSGQSYGGTGGTGGSGGYGGANNQATGGGGGGGGGGGAGGYNGANGSAESVTWISGNTTISITTVGGAGGAGGAGGDGGTGGYGLTIDSDHNTYFGGNGGAGGSGGGAGGGGNGGDGGAISFLSPSGANLTGGIILQTVGAVGGNGGDGGNGGSGGLGGYGDFGTIWYNQGATGAAGVGGNGGNGGNGGSGGAISGSNASTLTNVGILARSSGRDGGNGGNGGNDGNGNISGAGGNGGNGGASGDIILANSGQISTTDDNAHGIYSYSVGGDGGNGGYGSTYGVGGNGGYAGNIGILNTGAITTTGESAFGIRALNAGGEGGYLYNGSTPSGTGGSTGDIAIMNAGAISTLGESACGVSAESYGGYGVVGGNSGSISVTNAGTIRMAGLYGYGVFAVTEGANGSTNGGSSGDINIANSGSILISGLQSEGIYAYAVGGVGGNHSGYAGNVNVTNSGLINLTGNGSYGIVASNYVDGVSGSAGNISVDVSGSVIASGSSSKGILGYSYAYSGNLGTVSVTVSGLVSGGYGDRATGVYFDVSKQNTLTISNGGIVTTVDGVKGTAVYSYNYGTISNTIYNSGLIVGSVDLVGSYGSAIPNTLYNYEGGAVYSGSAITLGAANTFYNSGLFLPGGYGSIMQTAITGNYISDSTSVSAVKIGGTSRGVTYDYVTVSGTASVNGTLRTLQFNKYVPNPVNAAWGLSADTFNVLTAGTLAIAPTAKLDDYYIKNYLVKLQVAYNTTDLYLVTKQSTFDTLFDGYHDGLTSNQRATAKALDKAIVASSWNGGTDTRANKLISRLDDINKSGLRKALDQIAPEELGTLVDTGLGVVNAHELTVFQRLEQLRLSSLTCPAPVAAKEGKAIAAISDLGDANGFYLAGNVYGAKVDDQDNIKGDKDQAYGATLGYDARVSDNLRLGIAGSYIYNDVKFNSGGKANVNNGTGSIYASLLSGNFHFDGLLGGGAGSYDITRKGLDGADVKGDTSSAEFHALLGAGYDIPVQQFTFTPKATLAYTHLWMNGFTESGSLAPLKINDFDNTSSLKLRFGSSAVYQGKVADVPVAPEIGLYWQHEFMDPNHSVTAHLASGAGGTFTVDSASASRDSFVPTVAVNVKLTQHIDFRLAGEATLFNNAPSYNSMASVSIGW